MRIRTWGIIGCVALAVSGCSRFSESRFNPMGWFGGSSQPETLEPKGGYPTSRQDTRLPVAHITAARWEPLYEGRMLVVTGLAATKGWSKVALVTEMPLPPGRIRGDDSGVLRLRLVGNPPAAGSYEATHAANPASDTLTVAMTIPTEALVDIREVVVTGGTNAVTLRR